MNPIMKLILVQLFFALTFLNSFSQGLNLKEQALEEFKKEHYSEAIVLLEKAAKQNPHDAEVYYYLGWFNHYRAYDSRPFRGYNYSYSEKIFKYLDKALELKPDYGDAKYFYGAECSGNAFIAMQNYDLKSLKYFYKLADEKGAYPLWLKEFGRNFLNSCDENAILFTGGNADFDVCAYLQLHEYIRTDVTLIPIGNIDRPWYVKFLKDGLEGGVKKIEIQLTEKQILDMHPYKWDTTDVSILISQKDKVKFNLSEDYKLKWQVEPDLFSERMHSKIESEKAKKRTYLSPQRAVLLQIVEDNFSERPVFFSNFCSSALYGGLNKYFQNCGMVSRLTPVITHGTEYTFDYGLMEILLQESNVKNFNTITNTDMPRISGVIASGYYQTFFNLSEKYDKEKRSKERLQNLFVKYFEIGYNTEYETETLKALVN